MCSLIARYFSVKDFLYICGLTSGVFLERVWLSVLYVTRLSKVAFESQALVHQKVNKLKYESLAA